MMEGTIAKDANLLAKIGQLPMGTPLKSTHANPVSRNQQELEPDDSLTYKYAADASGSEESEER
jgi:hypothetical protein